jgi:alkanesulfonate monooxygenase SsuD/methylene tetrahydromethanopterin reductase-like flavin-dependent oxidoreductase (luciferase family)
VPDYGHDLEFGVFVTPSAGDADAVVALAELAESLGLDLVTFQDHPYQPRFLDTWTLLAYVAGRTTRIRLAPNVLNLPLRPPAVVARAVASLDLLSGGRAELGLGAGAFWDGIAAMGGPRRGPGESVEALDEAIDVIRALWDVERSGVRFEGRHYELAGAKPGPAPLHDVAIWLGAYKPRMLALTGRKADGWLPSEPYLQPGDLRRGNAAIDEAARAAGRDPRAIRRLLNLGPHADRVGDLTRLALEDGVATFVAMADDEASIRAFAEVAPQVRDRVAAARAGAPKASAEPEGLRVAPTPDDGRRLSSRAPWDETTRPHRAEPPPRSYSERGRLVAQHLVDVHDMLRRELGELRDVLAQVEAGAIKAAEARSVLNEMALRRNDWTLGAFCSRYCGVVQQHHGLEDDAIFPHLVRSEPELGTVVDRLVEEHLVIHDAIQAVDAALVAHIASPEDYAPIRDALDFLSDALLSHLSYEEVELLEPLARLGFYPGQL